MRGDQSPGSLKGDQNRSAATDSQPKQFRIHGMHCAEEVATLKEAVGPLVGGADRLGFDILNRRMTVPPDAPVSVDEVIRAVARTGMRAEVWTPDGGEKRAASFLERWGRVGLASISGLATACGFFSHVWLAGGLRAALEAETVPLLVRVFYGAGVVTGIWYVLPNAWRALQRLRPDMNLLMAVAVTGAVTINQWFEAAVVSFLFTVSLLLESWSVDRARRAIAELMSLAPETARVRHEDGSEEEVPAELVEVGTLFVVRPGERIPLDGRVVEGESSVNQAPITGESRPVEKRPDDEVFAGTINGEGALTIRSTKEAGETTLAHIIQMVSEAQSRRGATEKWVEKFARVYTPVVMGLAILVALAGPLLAGADWMTWLYNALVLLVIACPCALVISTPVSIVAALAAAARQGVLIKGGTFVEAPAHLKAIAFDKTGTLTEGNPTVVEVVPLSGHDEQEVLQRAAAMEASSNHPLAQAICAYAEERAIRPARAESFQIIPGKGATAVFDGRPFWIGSHRFLEERRQETPEVHRRLEEMAAAGRSVVVVGNDHHVCGLIALADTVRPAAPRSLRGLREAGIEHLVMLTGDNEPTAREIASQIGVTEFKSELLPADKVAAIDSLVSEYGYVAMVGDGVNDAPAMARANVGIAMGAAGSDAAIETADIALMSDDLSRLPWLIRHSRRTLAVIRQNIVFSLSVKALFVILTFLGHASLWAAIAADMGASLLVIFNGLRLLTYGRAPEATSQTASRAERPREPAGVQP